MENSLGQSQCAQWLTYGTYMDQKYNSTHGFKQGDQFSSLADTEEFAGCALKGRSGASQHQLFTLVLNKLRN